MRKTNEREALQSTAANGQASSKGREGGASLYNMFLYNTLLLTKKDLSWKQLTELLSDVRRRRVTPTPSGYEAKFI